MRTIAVLVLALALAGCGGAGRAHGTATLWVTRDRGTQVLFAGSVPAGLNGIQALERRLKVTTRYGGRYVQSIAGVEGSLGAERDWFYFVNGIEGNRSAAEVRLRPGDVEWWDYRSWAHGQMSVPVVVGAWPKPVFGRAAVVAADAGARGAAQALARSIHAVARGTDRVVVTSKHVVFRGGTHGSSVWFEISAADALRLARDPRLARHRYEGIG